MQLTEFLLLDGGLATQLEARGHDLRDELWSARMLQDGPDEIQAVHADYLQAGADIITTASYQASLPGFLNQGVEESGAIELIRRSVQLGKSARDTFWRETANRISRRRPLVAASIGPYGAFLANGGEYLGDYSIGKDQLMEFHLQRWMILFEESPDVMLCETIPSLAEVEVLAELSKQTTDIPTWVSLSCRDADHLCDGTDLFQCVRLLDHTPSVSAIGVNCIPPSLVSDLIRTLRRTTEKPIVVYPNSGESWDAIGRQWHGDARITDFADAAEQWLKQGTNIIGGCCRTNPEHIRELRKRLHLSRRKRVF